MASRLFSRMSLYSSSSSCELARSRRDSANFCCWTEASRPGCGTCPHQDRGPGRGLQEPHRPGGPGNGTAGLPPSHRHRLRPAPGRGSALHGHRAHGRRRMVVCKLTTLAQPSNPQDVNGGGVIDARDLAIVGAYLGPGGFVMSMIRGRPASRPSAKCRLSDQRVVNYPGTGAFRDTTCM